MTVSPPTSEPAPTPKGGIRWVSVAMVLGFVAVFAALQSGRNTPETPYQASAVDACRMAKKFVEDQLKAPSTAIFQDCNPKAAQARDGTWSVGVVVDAQNSFGAMLRNRYFVSGLRYVGQDDEGYNWKREKPIVDLGR